MIYIVMIGDSYDGTLWEVDKVFSTEDSAKKYIAHKKITSSSDVEYAIIVEELYA